MHELWASNSIGWPPAPDHSGGLYASLMNQYGTKEDSGAFILMSLESGPLMTMVILCSAELASFEPHHFTGAVLPFLVGFRFGNLDNVRV